MSAEIPISDDLAAYISNAIASDLSFKATLEDAEDARRLIDSLVALRKRLQLNQVEVAEHMGVRQPTVSGFEKGSGDPRLSTVQRYARALDARVRLVLEIPSDRRDSTWRRCSPYTGSARARSLHTGADTAVLKKSKILGGAALTPVRVVS